MAEPSFSLDNLVSYLLDCMGMFLWSLLLRYPSLIEVFWKVDVYKYQTASWGNWDTENSVTYYHHIHIKSRTGDHSREPASQLEQLLHTSGACVWRSHQWPGQSQGPQWRLSSWLCPRAFPSWGWASVSSSVIWKEIEVQVFGVQFHH